MKVPAGAWTLAITLGLSLVIGGQYATEAGQLTDNAFFAALTGGTEVPLLTHALLALPVLILLGVALVRRQVIQVPAPVVSISILFLAFLLCASVLFSVHRGTSLSLLPEWLTYLAAIYAAVATVGRKAGPRAVVMGAFAGGAVVALRGAQEYSQMKGLDANWRIFAGWINPNAAATALMIGFLCGLTVTVIETRAKALLAGAFTALCGLALMLTQSRGGLLITGVSTVFLLVMVLAWSSQRKVAMGRLGAVLVASAVLAIAAAPRTAPISNAPSGGSGGGFTRLQGSSESTDQSTAFRKNLYAGALGMMRANPVGYGLGSYRYESARSGLNTQTVLAHNAFLQLGTEATVLMPILLLSFGGVWLWLMLRGSHRQPEETKLLKAGIVATVIGIAAHSFIDSDLYYFGAGLPFFILVGVGLLLASDAVTPEYTPRPPRLAGAAALGVVALIALLAGTAEASRARARALLRSNPEGGIAAARSAAALWPFDGEPSYLIALTEPDAVRRTPLLQEATEKTPSARNYRALSDSQRQSGDRVGAISSLNKALVHDPSNLPALWKMLEIYRDTGDRDGAVRTARRLLEVEDSPYFKVRSLEYLVPTETFRARIYLASLTNDPLEVSNLLRPAVAGFADYAKLTVFQVQQVDKQSPGGSYAGESMDDVQDNMRLAELAARRLEGIQRTAGDAKAAGEDAALAERFATLAK